MSDIVGRLLIGVRRLDEAGTLRGILDALADGAVAEGLRVAVLLIDRGALRAYRHHGFAPAGIPPQMDITVSVAMSQAVVKCQPVPLGSRVSDVDVPAFLRTPADRSALVLPLVVDQSAVALVYVDGPADRLSWTDAIEVLVRHGSARLESVTSQRTVEALTASS